MQGKQTLETIYVSECIIRALVARGHEYARSRCGRYAIIDGRSGHYDDLRFFLRCWRDLA